MTSPAAGSPLSRKSKNRLESLSTGEKNHMPQDTAYYYDFNAEQAISDWSIVARRKSAFTIQSTVQSEGGDFLLLFAMPSSFLIDQSLPRIQEMEINGKRFDLDKDGHTAYIGLNAIRYGLEVQLQNGSNEFLASGSGSVEKLFELVRISLGKTLSTVKPPPPLRTCREFPLKQYPLQQTEYNLGGFTPGIGCQPGIGRFGFSKGDGLLDCAMPTLGNIDKMYLCGHPQYQKPFRWNYSTLPAGAARHGSFPPANHGIDEDEIQINHLSVRWAAKFGNTHFACTYSLASPGIITESDSGIMRISDLEFAGNYQYMLIPRANGELEISSIREVNELDMGENFLLLFGCTEFPDLPLLLVFQNQPDRLKIKFNPRNKRLSEIVFHNCPLIITATPFGIESFQPLKPDDDKFLHRAVDRCRFWSRALLAFPTHCKEYFRNDEQNRKTRIIQRFSYRMIKDAWGTTALPMAPLPPMTSLCGILETEASEDFQFPGKYGYLRGAFGDSSAYTLPYMPSARKFPLRDLSNSEPDELLNYGLRDYLEFAASFPETTQAYPYAGSLLEPYALPTTMMNFMNGTEREILRKRVAERMKGVCDPERSYDYPVIDWSVMMKTNPDELGVKKIYSDASMKQLKLWNWYRRTEPFTGIQFHICYLNVGFFSSGLIKSGTREEIAGLKIPLIENDWGAGLTFYYLYLAALASGDFSPIRAHWKLLNSVYSFFEKTHDWACLGSGYSDNAILWVEGANYGIYTSFINLAQAMDDQDAYQRAQYMAAKQFALRMSVVRAARHYFCKYYNVEPWDSLKLFLEEATPCMQHQGVPKELEKYRFRRDGVYNLTTEGLYPEFFTGMRQFQPEMAENLMRKLHTFLHDDSRKPSELLWSDVQQTASLLIDMALNPAVDSQMLRDEIDYARKKGNLMEKWRGIHIFSRCLPKNYLESQLLAWNAMKNHPLWLEHWQDVKIDSADWDGSAAIIHFQAGKAPLLRLGFRKMPVKISLNENALIGERNAQTLTLRPPGSGILLLAY